MKDKLRIVAEYAGAVILCLLILTCVMKLWRADFRIPFTYFGDALLNSVAAKGAIEEGWWLHNGSLGAPAGLDYAAYPTLAAIILIAFMSAVVLWLCRRRGQDGGRVDSPSWQETHRESHGKSYLLQLDRLS